MMGGESHCSRSFALVVIYFSVLFVTTSWSTKLVPYPVMYNNSQLEVMGDTLNQIHHVHDDSLNNGASVITLDSEPLFPSNCGNNNNNNSESSPPCTSLSDLVPAGYSYQCKMVEGGGPRWWPTGPQPSSSLRMWAQRCLCLSTALW